MSIRVNKHDSLVVLTESFLCCRISCFRSLFYHFSFDHDPTLYFCKLSPLCSSFSGFYSLPLFSDSIVYFIAVVDRLDVMRYHVFIVSVRLLVFFLGEDRELSLNHCNPRVFFEDLLEAEQFVVRNGIESIQSLDRDLDSYCYSC